MTDAQSDQLEDLRRIRSLRTWVAANPELHAAHGNRYDAEIVSLEAAVARRIVGGLPVLLSDGTTVSVGETWAVTTLPSGEAIHAHPSPDSPPMAERLGYGDDVAAMTRHHDPLHALLAHWTGVGTSSLRAAAGLSHDARVAGLEEDVVLALQTYLTATGVDPTMLLAKAAA